MRIEEEIITIMKSKDNELIKKIISVFPKEKLKNLYITEDCSILPYYVRENNLEIVEYLIKRGCDIQKKDQSGDNLLYYVSCGQYENVKMLEYLIQKGIDVNCVSRIGNTPLMWAALYEKWDLADKLIKLGADSKKESLRNRTFGKLLYANGDVEWISYFLENENLFTTEEVKLLKTKRLELIMK